MKTTIEVPSGLAARIHSLKSRIAQGEEAGERLVEIAILTRGCEALEQRYPEKAPALAADVEPAGKLGGVK